MNAPQPARAAWLGLLARSPRGAIEARLADAPALPDFVRLRGPEIGMSMVRGRAGGGGAAFNLGEMTISRCSIRDEDGFVGHGYVAGRDGVLAELIARLDAALQNTARHAALHAAVLAPLGADEATRRAADEARAAGTEVRFFTLATMR
ncbi:MAG: phosphonate C-P lyase system protein PhnG [Acidiphilium sp. 37-67-22]|nr:MAG: phosphonate C-P lyase system protein PhnG [Acidiphilium sp. 37-67-22]HQT74202.1 phosphonate C-P lyase system protein PhnG [Acidiphilium sp.]